MQKKTNMQIVQKMQNNWQTDKNKSTEICLQGKFHF